MSGEEPGLTWQTANLVRRVKEETIRCSNIKLMKL